jgi:D-alanine-D-alanine ligase
MVLSSEHSALVKKSIQDGKSWANETAIILVISVRGLTRIRRDYDRHSVSASFLTAEELDDVISGYRQSGFYVQHFSDETDFIKWFLSGGFDALPYPKKLLYTSAVNGTGAGRRCLVPSFCALEGIPTMNSDAYSCAINRQKFHWGRLLNSFNITVPTSWHYDPRRGWWMGEKPQLGYKVISKATFEGSSIGLTEDGVGEWSPRIEALVAELARDLQQPILVQTFITGDEIEIPVMEFNDDLVPFPLTIARKDGTQLGDDFLSYHKVWEDEYRYMPANGVDENIISNAKDMAIRAVKCLNFRGFSRIDLRIDRAGRPFVIDVSTTPHLTRNSSFAYLFEILGYGFESLGAAQVGAALSRHQII